MTNLPALCPFTSPRFDDVPGADPAAPTGQTAAAGGSLGARTMDISSLLPGEPASANADLTRGTITVTGGVDENGSAIPADPAAPTPPVEATPPNTPASAPADNAEASAAAAAAIVEAAARAPEATAFEVPVDAIRGVVANFDTIGADVLPQLTEIMGGDATVAQQFVGIMNNAFRTAIGDGMVFSAELSQRHSQHLMGQQQALTQDQQLRSAIAQHMPEGATEIQINGAIATARGLRQTNPTLPVETLASVSAQLVAANPTTTRQAEQLNYSNNTTTQMADMRRAFGLPT